MNEDFASARGPRNETTPCIRGSCLSGDDRNRMDVAVFVILANIFNSLYCLQLCFAELYGDSRTCTNLSLNHISQNIAEIHRS